MTYLEQKIEDAVDELILRIKSNGSNIGNPKMVTGDIELPKILDKLPLIAVIPIAEGTDSVTPHMTGDEDTHRFPIDIIGYFKGWEPHSPTDIQRYGYSCLRLVKGVGHNIGGLSVQSGSTVRFGEFLIGDKLVYTFRITLNMITISN
jgi:hypothetical protein